jgi:hypothetical protein
MSYLQKRVILPLAIATSLLTVGNASAEQLASMSTSTSQNSLKVAKTLQNIEKDTLPESSIPEYEAIAQNVTSVSQLSDVKPTDWAFTSLQSLVERYGCIAGYPDRTFRGKQALSRYEFAAGLNACLDKINEIISAGLADKVGKEDLATLKKLQDEFSAELATLRGRVDALDAKTAKLEAQQFSTTTKLNATVIFALADTWGGVGTSGVQRTTDNTNLNFSYRARLNFDTSFTGKDLLRTRLQVANQPDLGAAAATNTRMARLAFRQDTGNTFQIDKFYYRFPIGESLTAYLGANALDPDDVGDTLNPYFESSDKGALSRFGRYDPLTFRGPSGAGLGLVYKINPQFTVIGSYLANASGDQTTNIAASATGQGGLFSGGYIANVQVVYSPSSSFKISGVYAHSFEPSSIVSLSQSTGSDIGNKPFGSVDTSSDRYGAQFEWKLSKGFNFGGWVGFANARQESGAGVGNTANLFNWSVNFAFPDLFAEGNRGGIIFGQPPKVTSNTSAIGSDKDTSYLLELQYNFRLSKNITVTPGIVAVFNPNHNASNPTTYVGVIKTLFTF